MGSAVWVVLTVATAFLMTLYWTEHFDLGALEVLVALLTISFVAFVGTIYFTAVWLKFGKPVFGTPARWRLTTWLAWFVVVPMLCLAFVLNSQHHSLGNLLDDHSFVIPPEWSVREPILLARVETHSPLTPWLGAGFLERRSASLVTSIVQAPLSLSTPHQTSTPEPWFWTHRSSYLHQAQVPRASADFLWSQTTELASTALSAQTTVLRAFHAKTYAIYEDSITVAQSTRDTADLSSSVYFDKIKPVPYSTATAVPVPMRPRPSLTMPVLDIIKQTLTPLVQKPYKFSNTTCSGVPITVQLGPRHQHNGTPKGSTPRNTIVNHISWVFTSAISGFGVNVIIAALPTVEL
ncbi:hypothetical protein WJX82_003588 [Trebouxia sp. C0006]